MASDTESAVSLSESEGHPNGNGHAAPKKRNRSSSLHAENHTGFRIAKASRKAFLPDEKIAQSWTWNIAMAIFWIPNQFLHRLSWEGYDMKPGQGYLIVAPHSTHNADIPMALLGNYKRTGRIMRGLVHRTVMASAPWLGNIGLVPGFRDTAERLLKEGFMVAVIPGGAEEAMRGHENAYNLDWPANRRGFAKVAMRSSTPIVPVFYSNVDEMRFNPVFWLWNFLSLSVLYDAMVNAQIPVISSLIKILAEAVWFYLALFSIPVPAKVTCHVGNPIETSPESDIDEVVRQTREGLQALIDKWQPDRKKSYRRAFRQWREDIVNDGYAWKTVELQSNCTKKR